MCVQITQSDLGPISFRVRMIDYTFHPSQQRLLVKGNALLNRRKVAHTLSCDLRHLRTPARRIAGYVSFL